MVLRLLVICPKAVTKAFLSASMGIIIANTTVIVPCVIILDVVARPQTPGQNRLEVSQRSLARWTPNPVRQAARKQE